MENRKSPKVAVEIGKLLGVLIDNRETIETRKTPRAPIKNGGTPWSHIETRETP